MNTMCKYKHQVRTAVKNQKDIANSNVKNAVLNLNLLFIFRAAVPFLRVKESTLLVKFLLLELWEKEEKDYGKFMRII